MSLIHNSQTCELDGGNPCVMCSWANDVEAQRGYNEWSLDTEMSEFARRYGYQALAERIALFMAATAVETEH
jgi:hypothetical protein